MSNQSENAGVGAAEDQPGGLTAAPGPVRGRRGRVLLPAALAVVVAAGVAVVPALAASQDLPSVTAQQLLAKVLSSKVQTFSGTVTASVDLGLPAGVSGLLPSAVPSAASGKGSSTTAAAEKQLLALLAGGQHTFTVAADGPDRQLVSSADSGSAFTLVHNGGTAWAYDAQGNTATEVSGIKAGTPQTANRPTDPQTVAAEALKALGTNTTVSVAGTSKVAGQSVYELSVKPKGSGSTIGEVRIAVDADNGLPLQVRVNPSDGSSSILNVAFATVSFATPSASTFSFTPPSGAKVTKEAAPADSAAGAHAKRDAAGKGAPAKGAEGGKAGLGANEKTIGTGWSTIYSFTPSSAAGKTGGAAGGLGSLKALGKQVPGGTLVQTKLVNVLIADNGTVYAGAVTPALLEQAAGK